MRINNTKIIKMIRTQKQVKKDIQTFDDIIVSLKKQLKYVELSRHEMTKQLTIPVVVGMLCDHNWHHLDNHSDRMMCVKCDKRI